jgi:hypothetical protein
MQLPHPRTHVPRNGKDVGRSVEAYGYWGDVVNSPYHCFGTTAPLAPDAGLFSTSNRQFSHSAMDVAEHNVMVGFNPGQRGVVGGHLTGAPRAWRAGHAGCAAHSGAC